MKYDDWLSMPYDMREDPKDIGICVICGHEISEDEDYWDIEGDLVCDDCLHDYCDKQGWRHTAF